jgi:hypothetical protein
MNEFTSVILMIATIVAFCSIGVCRIVWPKDIVLTDEEKDRIARRIREAKSRAHEKNLTFDLVPGFIVELYKKQQGLCYFSKKLMTWDPNLLTTVAIIRKYPDKPYLEENIVLCCNYVAHMVSDHRYETLLENCRKVVENRLTLNEDRLLRRLGEERHLVKHSDEHIVSPQTEKSKHVSGTIKQKNRSETVSSTTSCNKMLKISKTEKIREREDLAPYNVKRCSTCERILPFEIFSHHGYSPDGLEYNCKDCVRKRFLENKTVKTRRNQKIWSCKCRADKKKQPFDINVETVEELYAAQKGLCYYTGIPMTWDLGQDNTESIDRVDSLKSYVKENVVLCSVHINRMKNEAEYETFLDYCTAIASNPLSLDDPGLRKKPNEGYYARNHQKAVDRKPEFDEIVIEKIGKSGLCAYLSSSYCATGTWMDYCSPSICERAHPSTVSSADK